MKKQQVPMILALAALAALAAQSAFAHGVWFANRLGKVQLVLGEGADDRAYDPAKVLAVKGYNAEYGPAEVKRADAADHLTIEPAEDAAVVTATFFYDYWTVTDGKWKRLSPEEAKTAENQIYNIKYDVYYRAPVKAAQPVADIPFQVAPMTDPTALKAGDALVVQALRDGKPLAGAEIIPDMVNNPELTVKTDAEGKAAVLVRNSAFNIICLETEAEGYKDPANPKVTKATVASCLSFQAKGK